MTRHRATHLPIPLAACLLLAGAVSMTAGCDSSDPSVHADAEPPVTQQSAFRVRSDASADLNADAGWAGQANENVTVDADAPFRLRFELETSSVGSDQPSFQLQSRRNGGEWQPVGAENFPKPEKLVEIGFEEGRVSIRGFEGTEVLGPSQGWRLDRGDGTALSVAREDSPYLRASGEAGEVLALGRQDTHWGPAEFATEMRLMSGDPAGAGLVFGYHDPDNYHLAHVDPAGIVSVRRVADGVESRLADGRLEFDPQRWFELKVVVEKDGLVIEVERGDQALRLPVEADVALDPAGLGFRVPDGGVAGFRSFAIEGEPATPRVSVIASEGYRHGEETTDLLAGSDAPFTGGAGISFADRTPSSPREIGQSEWEWPLVIRRFADGPVMNRAGDVFEFRMGDADGQPVEAVDLPRLTLDVPDGHVGGTFVETPARIGPWQADNGDLYFLIEPAETFNVLMTVKSSDSGKTWREVDGDHRPATGDLEGFGSVLVGDTIHMVHQTSDDVWYHAFRTADHPTSPDTWSIRDERIASPIEPPTQVADIAVRSDGSIVVVYGGPEKIHLAIRSPDGRWGEERVIDADVSPNLSGPMLVRGADDVIHLAYTGSDGSAWYRRLEADGELTRREQVARGLGSDSEDVGSILPLVYLPESNTVSIVYRLDSGILEERRSVDHGPLNPAVPVSDRAVVQNAVDADQTGADAIADGETLHLLFIDERSRQVFHTRRAPDGDWSSPVRQTEGVQAQWVRGARLSRDGTSVYGYVFDAGSDGGSGRNRYREIVLDD